MKLQPQVYDVVIMGAGFAGVCQARHLLLKIPNLKIALVDPRSEARGDRDLKVGESLVEVSSIFVGKELGLYEYMIENHTPKSGLNFHWAKDPAQTETLEDYYSVWNNRQPAITTFHINRAKFERDLLRMNQEMGADFYQGAVIDLDLTPGDTLKTVAIRLNQDVIRLKTRHVIDAAGRKFIIGRKTDNLIFSQPEQGVTGENLYGLNSGSAWVRVKNFDRTLFHDGYDPLGATTSHYYATNHWFGQGHWLWMIPISSDPMEISIGIVHHHKVIPAKDINTLDKFYDFLKENHTILYKLLNSGENIDFHYLPRLAHSSKTLFSPDNWYVVGDSACIFDAFYSFGATIISFSVESITEIISAKLTNDKNTEKKRSVYNEFNLAFIRNANGLIRYHDQQLGNASIMSWRIYFEYMWWFGLILPLYIGKWHLDLSFASMCAKTVRNKADGFLADVYEQFNQLVEQRANIGLMEAYYGKQLYGHYHTSQRFDLFLENAKYEPKRLNIFSSIKATYFYVTLWYILFQWRGFGWSGLLSPRTIYHVIRLLALSSYAAVGEVIYRIKMGNMPNNREVANMRQAFKKYRYQPKLQPWITKVQ